MLHTLCEDIGSVTQTSQAAHRMQKACSGLFSQTDRLAGLLKGRTRFFCYKPILSLSSGKVESATLYTSCGISTILHMPSNDEFSYYTPTTVKWFYIYISTHHSTTTFPDTNTKDILSLCYRYCMAAWD